MSASRPFSAEFSAEFAATPASITWATVDDVLAVLRLRAGDVDETRVAAHLATVEALVAGELAHATVPDVVPAGVVALLHDAVVKATVDLYQAARAPGGWVDTGDDVTVRVSADPLAGVGNLLDAALELLGAVRTGFA